MDARDIACGGNDAATTAAHNDRFVAQFTIVPFLDAGIESVAIDMGDGEREQFVMTEDAPAAAGRAAAGLSRAA